MIRAPITETGGGRRGYLSFISAEHRPCTTDDASKYVGILRSTYLLLSRYLAPDRLCAAAVRELILGQGRSLPYQGHNESWQGELSTYAEHCTTNRPAYKRSLVASYLLTRTLWDWGSGCRSLSVCRFSGGERPAVLAGATSGTTG